MVGLNPNKTERENDRSDGKKLSLFYKKTAYPVLNMVIIIGTVWICERECHWHMSLFALKNAGV